VAQHRSAAWKVCALLLVSLAVPLVAAEWAVRALERSRGHWAVHDPLLGWQQKPGYAGRFQSAEFDTALRISAQGLREGQVFSVDSPRFRVALMGDSFAWGHGVEEDERFGERLAAARGPDFEVINFSVAGYGTDQHFLRTRRDILAFDPDLVIVTFYVNDLIEVQQERNPFALPKPRFELHEAGLELTNVPPPYFDMDARLALKPAPRPRLWHLARGLLSARPTADEEAHRFSTFPITLLRTGSWKSQPLDVGIALHERIYEALAQLCSDAEVELVVLEIPFKEYFIPDSELARRFDLVREEVPFDRTRELLEAWSARLGFRYLDPYAHLATQGGHELYFRLDRHLNAEGHRVLGEWLAERL